MLFAFFSLFLLYFIFSLNYTTFTYQVLSFYNKTDKIDFFRQEFLSTSRFFALKFAFITLYSFSSILFFWKRKILKRYSLYYKNKISSEIKIISTTILNKVKAVCKQLSFVQKVILIIPFFIYIIFWWLYGWQNDEVFSYTFLVDRGMLVCATYYPGPNNHIAFLIFAALLNNLIPSFFSDFICLKFPATLAAVFSLWLIWGFFYQKNQKFLAWIVFVLVAFHWGFFFYATHGRGYTWIVLFFLFTCFAVFKLISNQKNSSPHSKKYWYLWGVSLILGCYTLPIFIYVWFSSLMGLWIIGTPKIRKESIFASFVVGLIILFLYTPILIFNGLSAIISNSWIAPLSVSNWFQHFPTYLWEIHGITGILALITSLTLFFSKKEYRKVCIYFWCITYLPYLIVFVQKVLPFERVFLYRQIAELILLCFCIKFLTEKIISFSFYIKNYQKFFQSFFIVLAIFYSSFRMYTEYYHWNIRTNVYQFAPFLAKEIYKKNPSSLLVLEDTYNVFLRYYFRKLDTQIDVLPNHNTDYKIIILPKENLFSLTQKDSLSYFIFYEDAFVKGFERK